MSTTTSPYDLQSILGGQGAAQGLPGGQSQLSALLGALTGQSTTGATKKAAKGKAPAKAKGKADGSKTATAKAKGKAKTTAKVDYNLNPVTAAQTNPLVAQLQQALGLGQGGADSYGGGSSAGPVDTQTPTQAQYANAAAPNLSQYLAQLNQGLSTMGASGAAGGGGGLAAALQAGLGQEGQAESQMPAALQEAASNLGSAGLLSDLLKAAQYQAIYKQAAYGNPGNSDPALAQLYNTVVNQGQGLTGGTALGGSASTPAAYQLTPQSINQNPGTSATSSSPSTLGLNG